MAKMETFRDISRNVEGFMLLKIKYDGNTGLVFFVLNVMCSKFLISGFFTGKEA